VRDCHQSLKSFARSKHVSRDDSVTLDHGLMAPKQNDPSFMHIFKHKDIIL